MTRKNIRDMPLQDRIKLAEELYNMAEMRGEYKVFKGLLTPIMQGILTLAGNFIEDDVSTPHGHA